MGPTSRALVCSVLLTGSPYAVSVAAESTVEPAAESTVATAIFAGGCFWCMESPYDELDGVISTTSGYTAGETEDPTYKQVSAGGTGHTEAVEVRYDPFRVDYQKLLEIFWYNIDPTDAGGQFCDRGDQYRAGIYYLNDEQQQLAEASKQTLEKSGQLSSPVVTEVVAASEFYPAEDYHQDYYLKNPARYKFYRWGCGRDQRLQELWGDKAGHAS